MDASDKLHEYDTEIYLQVRFYLFCCCPIALEFIYKKGTYGKLRKALVKMSNLLHGTVSLSLSLSWES